MIIIEPNKKVIFFSLLIESLLYKDIDKKCFMQLGARVFDKYKNLKSLSKAVQFEKEYKDFNPLKLHYQYSVLATYTNEDFSVNIDNKSFEIYENKNDFLRHSEIIENLLPKISKEMDFDNYYETEIASEYENICKNVQKITDSQGNLYDSLITFWKLKKKPQLFFIPNFMAVGDCFGVKKGHSFFAISSAKINKENGEREFYTKHVISNAIHEFSHSFLDQSLYELNLVMESDTISKRIIINHQDQKLSKDLMQIYGSKFFLECFNRAATLRIKEMIGYFNITDEYFDMEKESGYLYTEDFYKNLLKDVDKAPVITYMETLKNIFLLSNNT